MLRGTKHHFARNTCRGHPGADAKGYVKMPNVDMLTELADMREASRSYTANTQVIKQVREIASMTIDLLRPS